MISQEEQLQRAYAVQEKYSEALLQIPHVLALGVGYLIDGDRPTDTIALIVMVDEKVPLEQLHDDEILPKELDGVPVDVQLTGGIFAQ